MADLGIYTKKNQQQMQRMCMSPSKMTAAPQQRNSLGATLPLRRYKWDVIKSLVKSATGWQARKLQELQIPTFGAPPNAPSEDTFELRSSGGGLKANLRSLLRLRSRNAKRRQQLQLLTSSSAAARPRRVSTGSDSVADSVGSGGSVSGGAGNDYVELMRDALKQRQRQHKVQLLLGNVPPLARTPVVAAKAAVGPDASIGS